MKKFEIVNALAAKHGLRNYLEICTPYTGRDYAGIDRSLLLARRLMYRCPPGYDDGLPIEFRTHKPYSHELVRLIAANTRRPPFQIIFIDSYHSYECTSQDLIGAWRLVPDDGIIVVHDCSPADGELSQPDYRPGSWFGVSYAAFIDFVLPRSGIAYYTVDADCGCGVIFKEPAMAGYRGAADDRRALEFEWRAAGSGDWRERYAFFDANRAALLNLISVEEFLSIEGMARAAE